MRTFEEAYAAALDQPAFSNGTEGYAWMDHWCGTCVHDKGTRDGTDDAGCALVRVALMGRTPAEWFEQPLQQITGRPEGQTARVLGDTYHCVEYRDEDEPGPGYEPTEPVSPNQLVLFDAEPFARPRMFADAVAQTERAK